jgi:dTDP-glucose pyrophosphorylase
MSIIKFNKIEDLTFVVLLDHITKFNIDKKILFYFPEAKIISLPKLLNGPVLTCLVAANEINDDLPIIFNDSDHMFKSSSLNSDITDFAFDYDGALLTFYSNNSNYSYVELENNLVKKTVEKKVVSNHAICGAYFFKNVSVFKAAASDYLNKCNYLEYFTSGLYNIMIDKGLKVKNHAMDFHLSFGTPDEYISASKSQLFSIMGLSND